MQKRPLSLENQQPGVDLIHVSIELTDDFPVSGTGANMHVPDSAPLTYLHYHDSLEIGYCYKGSGIFIVDDKIIPFSKGDASIIFKNEIHIAKSNPEDPSSWHFVNLDPVKLLKNFGPEGLAQLFVCLDGNSGFRNVIRGEENPGLVAMIMEIIEEIHNRKDMYRHAVKGQTVSLLAKLSRLMPQTGSSHELSRHSHMVRLSPALDHIARNYQQPAPVPTLAALCGMSVTNFRRAFSRTMGVSPLDYIQQIKIRMASVLLAGTDLPILEISNLAGYESLSSFNRYFKRIMQTPPREWRKQSAYGLE
jgi:AraC-like DNA-binding protein